MRPALFPTGKKTQISRTSCKELVPLPRDECHACHGPIIFESVGQLALFKHGGYGATRLTTFAVCRDSQCLVVRFVGCTEIRPERTR